MGSNGVVVRPVSDRLWSRVRKTETCWLWGGYKNWKGYGQIRLGSKMKMRQVHRLAWEILRGPIPEGLTIDHLCRVRHCVNPDHMEPVSNRVNVLRGLGLTAVLARRTQCPHGHEFTPSNTRIARTGERVCRTCRRVTDRRRRSLLKPSPAGHLLGGG